MTGTGAWRRTYRLQILQPLSGALVVIWIDGELLGTYFGATLAEAGANAATVVGEDVVQGLQSR